ncbi:cytoplasmic protein [Streptomyces sp. CB00455]|uniref:MSMEG_6728 family protein n=1 Tax=Streptomyces sp. CB00455 TaxID=1703927 RepID=UPI000939C605|nr:MSMEG_6728 family protein [Streptomyces sp. CB00455]OKK21913.1 cytoplasmic protein [Streptomyces sp. CB00455]
MQTFLPFPSFQASAAVLDGRRLGKQRVEAVQVLRGLIVPDYGWRRHPAVRMWAGYEEALVRYGLDVCHIWTARGRGDTCAVTLVQDFRTWQPGAEPHGEQHPEPRTQERLAADGDLPPWLGDAGFHRSHQSALVRKDPDFYRRHFPDVPDDLPYVWPASDRGAGEPT